MSCSNEELFATTPVSEMQKLMAEKAFKMPGENNPVMAHKYGADPAVLEYNDTLYVYSTNDMQQLEFTKGKIDNGYNKITTLNVFSTKDMVNWTDCGEIAVAGKNDMKGAAKWASNSWAPAVCWKRLMVKISSLFTLQTAEMELVFLKVILLLALLLILLRLH